MSFSPQPFWACVDDLARRRLVDRVLWIAALRIEARRERERRARVQERIDEEGCGAVMVLLRIIRDDWL